MGKTEISRQNFFAKTGSRYPIFSSWFDFAFSFKWEMQETALKRACPFTDKKNAKMWFLPVQYIFSVDRFC